MSDSDRGRVFRGQRSGHRRGRGAEGLARPPWSPSSLCSLRAIYSWGWSAVGVFEPSVVAGQRWRNHKRCQSREIKGGHLSSRLLGLSGAGLPGCRATGPPGRRATETDLGSVNTCEQTHEQERAAWAHSPPAWKKDDGMNDVSHCYTLQTPTHTYTQRTHTHTHTHACALRKCRWAHEWHNASVCCREGTTAEKRLMDTQLSHQKTSHGFCFSPQCVSD